MTRLRIVYFGTPDYAVPALEALAGDSRFEVVLVVTQPDRAGGRGHKLIAPAVKVAAESLGLPVYQPASLRTAELRQPLVDADADLFVVAAYGLIFGEKTLGIPRIGAVNLHASLLPHYRGANPIAAAIASGDALTGISLMVMERGLDSGPVIATHSTPILDADTTATLTERLATLGAELLIDSLAGFVDGSIQPVVQPDAGGSFARPMRKADGEIDWSRPAAEVDRRIRAMWPWPRAWSQLGESVVQIHAASATGAAAGGAPGTMTVRGDRVLVACGEGAIALDRIQFPGKSAIEAGAAVRGGLLNDGDRFDAANPDREPLVSFATDDSATNA